MPHYRDLRLITEWLTAEVTNDVDSTITRCLPISIERDYQSVRSGISNRTDPVCSRAKSAGAEAALSSALQ